MGSIYQLCRVVNRIEIELNQNISTAVKFDMF